ncbi:low molecular weight protein-tyrosine-phosphatase [Parahaliea aestuarii]|uniref:protein-tyrosine-phosphatase n=1 Tax=Parahaliea aestuarii TaxID=1852021 RepID=A0A5C8ZXA6_9GAMM|nr:low molecular weight protein-tyrosine-phosphatase [Parahaliea aestuarii]TXS93155.1 low molecular weight phosphotyrosine protein phosphatase [Parahaliea aestuarii]
MSSQVRILFVCLGNICRSPTAHGVFEQMVAARGLSARVEVDSCGTGDWHIGRAPDQRAQAAAAARGYDLQHLRARQVSPADFDRFDYILAMDESNLRDLQAMRPASFTGHLGLFLPFADSPEREVPDPYYGGDEGFDRVLDLIEAASSGLLAEIDGADRA